MEELEAKINVLTKMRLHPEFRLNNTTFTESKLLEYARSLNENPSDFYRELGLFLQEWLDESEEIALQTSGTTGEPKKIITTKKAMTHSALATATYFKLQAGMSALLCLPIRYVAGKMMLVRAMVLGLNIDVVEPSGQPLKTASKCYDFVAMVPMQLEHSLLDLHKAKTIIVGGAKISEALKQKMQNVSTDIYETYGMTETLTHIAVKKISQDFFEVLPHVEISQDKRKCLEVFVHGITNEKLLTNDVIEWIDSKRFLWKGRVDNIINSGGVKIFPETVEQKLETSISSRFFVIGEKDDLLGEHVVLVVEGNPIELSRDVFEKLEKYEKPKKIVFRKHFIETPSGKIKRKETFEDNAI